MKKKVLIIGNNEGLPGVKVDINNYQDFFKSAYGGYWNDEEIIVKLNTSRLDLLLEILGLKILSLDYLIIVLSGHGGQTRETIFELNSNGDTISESELQNIAKRQLCIYDCCRSYLSPLFENRKILGLARKVSSTMTRQKFETRILEAIPQQVSLYACSIGETANDTTEGGAYSKNLIKSSLKLDSEYKLIGEAHEEAKILTQNVFYNQHPDSILPRCFSSQQLIISINPDKI
jgi:hypothetical protein